jgi:hypothetical protein
MIRFKSSWSSDLAVSNFYGEFSCHEPTAVVLFPFVVWGLQEVQIGGASPSITVVRIEQ